jgi:hypothetical protein
MDGPVDTPARAFRQHQVSASLTWLSTVLAKLKKDFSGAIQAFFSPKKLIFPEQI